MDKPPMRRLDDPFFPVSPANQTGYLERDHGHRVYYEDSGNANGMPIIFCHGGPGGSSKAGVRRTMDSSRYRIIQFDQRGCGHSTPAGELKENNLQKSIEDMEALREHLGVERWIVIGGSWGSTLALAYSEQHPKRVLSMLLIGMWLLRRSEIDWWFQGVRTVFPELWEQFASLVSAEERHDLRNAYCKRILGNDTELAAEAGRRLYLYEEGFMNYDPPLLPLDETRGPAYGRIFAHYAAHDFFLRENQLIEDVHRVADIPTILLTGRYDMATAPNNAYDLAKHLNHVDLRIVSASGHYPNEKWMAEACVKATTDICLLAEQV